MIQESASLSEPLLAFQSKLDKYQRLLESTGKTVRRSKPAEAQRLLSSLTEPLLAVMDRRVTTETEILEQIIAAGEPATDPKRQLWRFIKGNHLVPCSDLFDKIADGDMIQIFSREHLMVFATSNIFDRVSYTLEQLFSLTWYECTIREPAIEQRLANYAIDMIDGKRQTTFCPDVPIHAVQEVNTERCLKTHMDVKWLSPIFFASQLSAIVVVMTMTLVDS